MSLNTVLLNEKSNNSKALDVAEKFIKKNKLKQKNSLHLRLLIEETRLPDFSRKEHR